MTTEQHQSSFDDRPHPVNAERMRPGDGQAASVPDANSVRGRTDTDTVVAARPWLATHLTQVACSDALVVIFIVVIAQLGRFGSVDPWEPVSATRAPALIVGVSLVASWLISLRAFQAHDGRIVGAGPQEYSRVATACFAVFGALAIIDLLFRLNIARGFLVIALPLGTLLLILSRAFWRTVIRKRRAKGECLENLLIVGTLETSKQLLKRLANDPTKGYNVVGIWSSECQNVPSSSTTISGHEIRIFGDPNLATVVRRVSATTVAVSSSEDFSHDGLRELSWQLEAMNVELLVAPGVVDVAGPRMHVRQVDGLPLLHIDRPRYGAAQSILKRSLDVFIATTALLVLFPLMLATAVAIWIDDRGPIFYRQARVGKSGRRFSVWKFRSMRVNAEVELKNLQQTADPDRAIFFKSEKDPRITRVGEIIRKTSIDELPQIINVLRQEMSIVGPRPLQPGEGAEVPNYLARRLLVKPGMTGLWQVSGRSDLPAEDRVRLDLLYVENWSLMQDIRIIWRTIRVVIGKNGAY